jgi:hypothetical protein
MGKMGKMMFRLACKRDLEGIVAKRSSPHTCRQREAVQDQESQLLAVGGARGIIRAPAVLHDLGLTIRYSAQVRFEVDRANATRSFLKERGIPAHQSQ